jgi:hypothetical protein
VKDTKGARGVQENYRAKHQGDGRDQFAHQEALVPPWKCFFIDLNIAAAQLCFQLHVHFRYSVTVSTNYVMPCVLVSNQLYAHLNTISNRIWICVAIIYNLQIQIKLLSAIL